VAHVETLLSLKDVQDCPAVAMVARALFELAIDIRLISAGQRA